MPKPIHRITTVIDTIETFPDGIRVLELIDPDRWELPPFTAGAHIDIHLPSGAIRQYSLCGDPAERRRYRIAVQLEPNGRGGSKSIHNDLRVGDSVLVSLPRNHFPLLDARHSVLIAGGIGITPFLSMIPEIRRHGRSYEVHHAMRSPDQFSLTAMIGAAAEQQSVQNYFSRAARPGRIDIAALIEGVAGDAHVYCCGPEALMSAVQALGQDLLGDRLHIESFGSATTTGHMAFEIELARSGRTIAVPQCQTILNALRNADIEIDASCEAGVCLECRTRVLAGTPVHRDLAMKPDDRRNFMTPCVSGCAGDRLVLDL